MQFINNALLSLVARLSSARDDANEKGQTLVEYALIIALVSVVAAAALTTLEGDIEGVFTEIATQFGV